MSFFPAIRFADSPDLDAFARLRVSNPETIFESKQLFDNAPLFWDDLASGGSTTSTHSTAEAASTMGVANTTAGVRTRQTFERFNYQPGKSHLIFMTGVLDESGGGSGITRAIGYFDDSNGLFFEDDEGTVKVVRRSKVTGSIVDTKVDQASWNLDVMDGSGKSGITLDFTKAQIFMIDFEWLSVGRVRFGFVIGGMPMYVHEIKNANVLNVAYMSTPNLPLRYRIENGGAGAASTMVHICSTVVSEGGAHDLGVLRYKSTGGTHVDCATQDTIYAIVGIRLKAAAIAATVKMVSVTMAEHAGTKNLEWILKWNPTVADTFTYADETNSAVQTATGGALNTVTGGIDIAGGFFSTDKRGGSGGDSLEDALTLGAKIDGTVDEIVLCARPVGGSTDIDVEGSLTWRELV